MSRVSNNFLVHCTGVLKAETAKAYLIDFHKIGKADVSLDGLKPKWIPKSRTTDAEAIMDGTGIELDIESWLVSTDALYVGRVETPKVPSRQSEAVAVVRPTPPVRPKFTANFSDMDDDIPF